MTEAPFTGYPGQVWGTCWQSLSWLSGLLASGTATPVVIAQPVQSVFTTLINALSALDAWQTGATLAVEAANLAGVEALPLPLDPTTTLYFNNRVTAVTAAATGVAALAPPVSPFTAIAKLQAGQPAIADSGFLEWCMTFTAETVPLDLTPALLPTDANVAAQSWLNVTNAIFVLQGASPTAAYDTAARQYRCATVVANTIGQLASGPFAQTDLPTLWNSIVALPTILLDSSNLASSPSSLSSQQIGVMRYTLIAQLEQLSLLLLSLRTQSVLQPNTANLRNSETLMDLAARTTGDYENWTGIAAVNQLQPPYPGPTNPAVALSGRALFLSGAGLSSNSGPAPTYEANVLGTDWDFGPINGPQPPWLGDISLITGYLNYARAIGRRLQTPLGGLIYHTDFGSRIPPEVGAIQSADEAARLNEYGRAAILSDPRTGTILSSLATAQPGFLATFSATVEPIGPGASPVTVNETLGAKS